MTMQNSKIANAARQKFNDILLKMQDRNITTALSLFIGIFTLLMMISAITHFPKAFYSSGGNSIKNNADIVLKQQKTLAKERDLYLQAELFGEQTAAAIIKNGTLLSAQNNIDNYDINGIDYSNAEPPKISVKAIIKTTGKVSAYVDISGVAEGLLVMPGMKILNYGEIVSVDDTGISWLWKDKSYRSSF